MSGTLRSMAAAPQPVSGHVNVMAHARSSMILPSTRALHAADSTMSLPMHSAAAARGYPQIGPQMASAMTAPQEMLVIPTESFAEDFLTCVTCQERFDAGIHQPKLLPCTHTVCKSCIESIIRTSGQVLYLST